MTKSIFVLSLVQWPKNYILNIRRRTPPIGFNMLVALSSNSKE